MFLAFFETAGLKQKKNASKTGIEEVDLRKGQCCNTLLFELDVLIGSG